MFCSDRYQSDVVVLGGKDPQKALKSDGGETLLWTLRGGAKVTVRGRDRWLRGRDRVYALGRDETLLLPEGDEFDFEPVADERGDAACLAVKMDPATKKRVDNRG